MYSVDNFRETRFPARVPFKCQEGLRGSKKRLEEQTIHPCLAYQAGTGKVSGLLERL